MGNNIFFTAPLTEGEYYMQVALGLNWYPTEETTTETELNGNTLVKLIVRSPTTQAIPTTQPKPTLAPTTQPKPTLAPTTQAPTTQPKPTQAPTFMAPMPIFDPIFESNLVPSPISTTQMPTMPPMPTMPTTEPALIAPPLLMKNVAAQNMESKLTTAAVVNSTTPSSSSNIILYIIIAIAVIGLILFFVMKPKKSTS
jgi:hypothetical protein